MSLYYISEDNILSSNFLSGGQWAQVLQFGAYSTAVNMRSLSISLFPGAENSTSLDQETSTTDVALLYCEDPNGRVSALLYRIVVEKSGSQDQWVNITSQESKVLPNEFRNTRGFNSSVSPGVISETETIISSYTLYESDSTAVYKTPFCSAPGKFESSVAASFYSPFNLVPTTTSDSDGHSFFLGYSYTTGRNGTGSFSLIGI